MPAQTEISDNDLSRLNEIHWQIECIQSNIPPYIHHELTYIEYRVLKLLCENPDYFSLPQGHRIACASSVMQRASGKLASYGYVSGKRPTKSGRLLIANIEACKHAE